MWSHDIVDNECRGNFGNRNWQQQSYVTRRINQKEKELQENSVNQPIGPCFEHPYQNQEENENYKGDAYLYANIDIVQVRVFHFEKGPKCQVVVQKNLISQKFGSTFISSHGAWFSCMEKAGNLHMRSNPLFIGNQTFNSNHWMCD